MDGNIDATAASVPAAAAQATTTTPCSGGHHHPVADDTAPISRIVAQVAAQCPGERISLGEMAEAFGDRAFGLLILVLLLPSLLPLMASVFGLPVLILGIQMGLGLRAPRLPAFLAQRTIARADLLRLSSASSTWLKRVETWVRPRPGFFTSPVGDKLFGWLSAYTAIMLILPGPGTNGPPAFGNIVMALGLVEHDSRVIGLGAALTFIGCAFATGVLFFLCWVAVEALGFFLF